MEWETEREGARCPDCTGRLYKGPYEESDEGSWGPLDPTLGTNGFAVASLVLSLLWVGGIGAILAIVFGRHARAQIRLYGGQQAGWGMATAGIIIGSIGLAGIAIVVIALIAAKSHGATS